MALLPQARKRCIDIRLMPPGMDKRRANTTFYRNDQDCIMWRVEFVFGPPPCGPPSALGEHVVRVVDDNMRGDRPLQELLAEYLEPRPVRCSSAVPL